MFGAGWRFLMEPGFSFPEASLCSKLQNGGGTGPGCILAGVWGLSGSLPVVWSEAMRVVDPPPGVWGRKQGLVGYTAGSDLPGSWDPTHMNRHRPLLASLLHLLGWPAGSRMWGDVALEAGTHAAH